MHLIGFKDWQLMWNWRGWWACEGRWSGEAMHGAMVGRNVDLWWFGPLELWHQK